VENVSITGLSIVFLAAPECFEMNPCIADVPVRRGIARNAHPGNTISPVAQSMQLFDDANAKAIRIHQATIDRAT
jgi:hypothetical protein